MRGVTYGTLAEAEAAQRAEDAAAGLPRMHVEGTGPTDFSIPRPGNAAERIRSRGVRTEHLHALLTRIDGAAYALESEAGPDELDADRWAPSRHGALDRSAVPRDAEPATPAPGDPA